MRFASGISYYTLRLANSLAERHTVNVVLLRELLPRFLFPGRSRVGRHKTRLAYDERIRVYDGIDWHLVPSLIGAQRFIAEAQPDVIILPWWTSSTAHTELLLQAINRVRPRARLLIEVHETLDPMEHGMLPIRAYSNLAKKLIFRLADGFIAHSEVERQTLIRHEGLRPSDIFVVPHGTYDNFMAGAPPEPIVRNDEVTYLFFGLVRPYKGVSELVRAFDGLPDNVAGRSRLVIAGETWEGYVEPRARAANSRHSDRISFIDRYLPEEEVASLFERAQVAVFPYLRAAQSGAVRVAMAHGLPVVASDVGGLGEACREYDGAILVPPNDVGALTAALVSARHMAGKRFPDPFPWQRSREAYEQVFESLLSPVPA
jgi:glycosyltransferase involved in cell wall biosynthesis